jgi:hypothetical protein
MPDKIVNLGGTIPALPPLNTVTPGVNSNSSKPSENLSANDLFLRNLEIASKTPAGVPSIPFSSFYSGDRYPKSRPFTDVEEMAAQQQSSWDKVGNGFTKMAGIASTTFISGTIGTVAGLVNMALDHKFSSFYDNPVNRTMDEWNKKMEDALPNYYTHAEQDAKWYSPDSILTANFFSDKVVKNLGYAIGAIGGGVAWGNVLKMMGLTGALVRAGQGLRTVEAVEGAIANAPKLGKFGAINETLNSLAQTYVKNPLGSLLQNSAERGIVSVMGTMGEASIEALQNMNQYRDNLIQQYIDETGSAPTETALEEINSYAEKVGNFTWGMNVALLSATNYIQLPKILGSSRSAEKALINDIEKTAGSVVSPYVKSKSLLEYVAGKPGRFVNNYIKHPISLFINPVEGFEEGSQFAIQTGVEDYFKRAYDKNENVDSFFNSLGGVLSNSVGYGVREALSTKEGMENILIGALSGGIMTSFSPLGQNTIKERGFFGTGGIRAKNTEAALKALNENDITKALKDGKDYITRAINSQARREQAILTNSKLEEKDEETNFLMSYIIPRIKYGKLDSIKQELEYYRNQAATDNGFDQLKQEGIVHQKETKADFFNRLNEISAIAENSNKTYEMLNEKYSSIVDEDKKRVYSDEVIEKMTFTSAKILDYDKRLASLQSYLEGKGVEAFSLKEALYQSGAWQEGRLEDAVREEGVVKAVTGVVSAINNMDITEEEQDNLKQDFNDYFEMALRRKKFMEEYNQIRKTPAAFKTSPSDFGRTSALPPEEENLDENGQPIVTKGKVKIKTVQGEKEWPIGEPLIINRPPKKDKYGNLVYDAPEFTILKDNGDGTVQVKNSDGTITDVRKSSFEKYKLGAVSVLKNKTTANYYRNHWNDVYEFNFGKNKGGKKSGRLSYDVETDSLYFNYVDREKTKSIKLNRAHFIAQEGFTTPLVTIKYTLVAETPEQKQAREAFLAEEQLKEEQETLAKNRDARLSIITELATEARERVDSLTKKIADKTEKLKQINKDLEELQEVKAAEPRTKKEKALEQKYPELSRQKLRFSKIFSKTTRAVTELAKLKENVEYELAQLTADKEELEFNLAYFEDFGQHLYELPENSEEFLEELNDQVAWLKDSIKQTAKDISLLSKILEEIDAVVKQFSAFLKDAFQKFDKDYPSYLRQSFDRMIEGKGILSEIQAVKDYISDLVLLEDTKKEISLNEAKYESTKAEMAQLIESLNEFGKELSAKEAIQKRFQKVVDEYRAHKKAEAEAAKNAALQEMFFGKQKQAETTSGDFTDVPPATDEELKEENKKLSPPKLPIEIATTATIVSSNVKVKRESDRRHDRFLAKVDKLPAAVRSQLRRMFITANNEAAFGLSGITRKHLTNEATGEVYKPKNKEDELILAVYVIIKDGITYFVDENGEALTVADGKEQADLNKVVSASMPSGTDKEGEFGRRYDEEKTSVEEAAPYYKQWNETREKILSFTDSTLTPEEFFTSNGVLETEPNAKNPIVGSLISQEQLDNNQPVVVVNTTGTIAHQGRNVKAPLGRIFIRVGGTLKMVNNRNLTENEAETVFQVLKKFVEEANKNKSFNAKYVRFLQGILFFGSPYKEAADEEDTIVKEALGRNQFYFHKGYFYFGKNEVKIPFTTEGLEQQKVEVKAFLKGVFNNVNNNFVKKNEPFTELFVDEKGELQEKEWPSYQTYLLSTEGRTNQELPLHTNARMVSPEIENDTNIKQGSKYSYTQSFVAEEVPEEKPTATATKAAPAPATKKSQTRLSREEREEIGREYFNGRDVVKNQTTKKYNAAYVRPDGTVEILEDEDRFALPKMVDKKYNEETEEEEVAPETIVETTEEEPVSTEAKVIGVDYVIKNKELTVDHPKGETATPIIDYNSAPEESYEGTKVKVLKATENTVQVEVTYPDGEKFTEIFDRKDFEDKVFKIAALKQPKPSAKQEAKPVEATERDKFQASLEETKQEWENSREAEEEDEDDESAFRLIVGSAPYVVGDLEEEAAYIKANTPFTVKEVEGLIEAGNGNFAFGSFLKGLIKLSDSMEIGTGYHEMFEGVFDVFLSAKEKQLLYKEFRSREGSFTDRITGATLEYKNATDDQAREQMAEEFRDKKLYDKNPPKVKTSFIKAFFDKLIKWINSIINGEIRGLEDLFKKMDSAYYKNAPYKAAPSEYEKYRQTIGSLDAKDSYTVVMNVVSRVFQKLFENDRLDLINELDFKGLKTKQVYDEIYADLEKYFQGFYTNPTTGKTTTYKQSLRAYYKKNVKAADGKAFTDAMYDQKFLPVWVSIKNDWDKIKQFSEEVLKTYRIVQQEDVLKEEEDSNYAGRTDDSYLADAFLYDGKKNAPASVKLLLATLQESIFKSVEGVFKPSEASSLKQITSAKDQSTGLQTIISYAKMFNKTLEELHSLNTLKEKEAAIFKLAVQNPNFVRLYNRLRIGKENPSIQQWALRIKFYNTFSKMSPEPLINYIQKDGTTTIGVASVTTAVAVQMDNWLAQLKNSKLVGYSNNKYNLYSSRLPKVGKDASKLFTFLTSFGIDFSAAQRQNLTSAQVNKLLTAVSSIESTFKQGVVNATSVKTMDVEGPLKTIFSIYVQTSEVGLESTFLNIEQERVQRFVQTNAISRIINDITKAASRQELLQLLPQLSSVFSSDSVYLNSEIFNEQGAKKDDILQIKYVMGTIDLAKDENIPTDKLTKADRLLQGINQNLQGNYYLMIPADSKTEYMVSMKNLYSSLSEPTLEQFYRYYQTEQALGGSENRMFSFLEDGLSYESFKTKFSSFIENEVDKQFQELSDYGIIKLKGKKDNTYNFKGISKDFIQGKYDHKKMTEEQIKEVLRFRTINFVGNNIEIAKLFFNDPALYKDPTKRFKSFLSPAEQSIYDTQEFDSLANEEFNTVDGIKLKKGDPGYEFYSDEIKTVSTADVETVVEDLKGYDKVNSTDGQGIATLAAMKQLRIKNGYRWSEGDEAQFQYEMAKDRLAMEEDKLFSYKGREELKKHDRNLVKAGNPNSGFFSPIKPVVRGFYGTAPLLDKFSIHALTYTSVRGKTLAIQYKRMLDNGISYIVYESGRKVGVQGLDSLYNADGEINTAPYAEDTIVNVPFKWFGIQVETSGIKFKQTFGSQMGKIGTINLMSAGTPANFKGTYEEWESLPEEKKDEYEGYRLIKKEKFLREALIEDGYEKLLKKVGIDKEGKVNLQKLLDTITDELYRREVDSNIKQALKINKVTNKLYIPLESLNNYEQIKSIIFSYLDKYITSPKLNGGPKIQVSGTGWEAAGKRVVAKTVKGKTFYVSTGLKFYTKEEPWMEVLLPAWFGRKLRKAGIDTDNINLELIDPEVLRAIGFRIPSQEMNSFESVRVAGFLPESMGDMIVVPEAITKKAGSDFDVDKLSMYLKNVFFNKKSGKIEAIPYFGTGKEAQQKIKSFILTHKISSQDVRPDADAIENLTEEDLKEDMYSDAEILQRQSIENEYFRTLEEIFSLPENFERMTTPNSSAEMEKLAAELEAINSEEFGDGATKSLLSPTYMNNLRHTYLVGKGGIGIAAVNQTNTALVQKAAIIVDPEKIQNLKDANEKLYIGDGKVNLPAETITVKGKEYNTISSSKDVAGRYISDKISQYINGFVDIAKNTFLAKLGVTRSNASTYMILEKLGVPTDIVIMFMNQPIIKEHQKNVSKAGFRYVLNSDIIKITESAFKTSKTIKEYPTQDREKLKNFLKENIESYYGKGKKEMTTEQAAFQHFVLKEYLKYTVMADNLFRLTQGTNFDTANFSSPYSIERKLIKLKDAEVNNIFSSASQLLNKTFLKKLSKTIVDSTDAISESIFEFLNSKHREYFMPVIKQIAERPRLSERDFIKIARKVEQSFINYLSQTLSESNKFLTPLLVTESTSLAREVEKIKKDIFKKAEGTTALANNIIITSLITENKLEDIDTKVVKLFNKGTDAFSKDLYIASMQELRDNPVTNNLYRKLITVGFLQSGIGTSPISFLDIVPVEDYKTIISYATKALKIPALAENFIKTDAFYRNYWSDETIVPRIKEKFSEWDDNEFGQGTVKNAFVNANLENYYKAKQEGAPEKQKLYAYKVYANSKAFPSKFALISTGGEGNFKQVLLRRVELTDGVPLTMQNEYGSSYGIYVGVNAWGDRVKAQEYYSSARKSVLNNKIVKIEQELSNEEILSVLAGRTPSIVEKAVKPAVSTTSGASSQKASAFEKAFSPERQQEIITNFAAKHKMSPEKAAEYIRKNVKEKGQEAIKLLKECY